MNAPTVPAVLPLEQARAIVEEHARSLRPGGTTLVPLLDSAGRVLADEICADRDFPPFSRSTRDGYAVRAIDVSTTPVILAIVGELRAGDTAGLVVRSGEAVQIMTGAPVPNGADAVVMVEYTSRKANDLTVERSVGTGDNVVPRAAEAQAGKSLLAPGHRMDPAKIAVAASVGMSELRVYAKPRVAILATGDELVAIGDQPGPSQIRNSNAYSLAAQVLEAGAEPVLLPVAPDEPRRLEELLREGFETDLLLVSGGVSVGKYDLVEQALSNFGAEFFFTGALIQPGRPVVFGRTQAGRYFLGLPGNPVSTMVTFELFAKPLINALCGASVDNLRFVQAKLKSDIRARTGLTRFLPAILSGEYHSTTVELVSWKGSGDIISTAQANCYIVVPRNRDHIFSEETVDVLLR